MGAPDNTVEAGTLIAGAGVAGLFTALKLARPVTVLAAAKPGEAASSAWAQGGIAAAAGKDDSAALHLKDTVAAGAGLVDERIARILCEEAPKRIEDLIAIGVPFDRMKEGALALGREAVHSRNRIVRVSGDRIGGALMSALWRAAARKPNVRVLAGLTAVEIAMRGGRAAGLFARDGEGRPVFLAAAQTVLALGGVGGLYEVTTNPGVARGDALAMAARAGARIADAEFVQFHPTALAFGRDPAPLATEALRGEGAILVNERGERFMAGVHEKAELAPRDVVARAIARERAAGRKVFLDARAAIGAAFPERFPTVYAACREAGIDPAREAMPVAPAAHYHMGGIAVDVHGRSDVPGLYAAGECACTGAHGANRLASNSLAEALVFGARAAAAIEGEEIRDARPVCAALPELGHEGQGAPGRLRKLMSACVGVERDGAGLARAIEEIARIARTAPNDLSLRNATTAALFIATAALRRTESRGAHWRADYPKTDEAQRRRSFLTLADVEDLVAPDARRAGAR